MATTSTTPITVQLIALPRSPASQKPLAALKQRAALVHPLTNAPGLLNISRIFIRSFYDRLAKISPFLQLGQPLGAMSRSIDGGTATGNGPAAVQRFDPTHDSRDIFREGLIAAAQLL